MSLTYPMKALSALCLGAILIFSNAGFAQISQADLPIRSTVSKLPVLEQSSVHVLERVNVEALVKEDKVTDQHKDIAWRFGAVIPVNFNLENAGTWSELPNGDKLWRLRIESRNAKSLNFNFDAYQLPPGASLHIYNPEKTEFLGAFTSENNKADSLFATFILKSDAAILEYYEPKEVAFKGVLSIESVVHGYRHLDKAGSGFGDAGLCNINVNCPIGAPWDKVKRSVVMIMLANNNRVCSGVLVNNTLEDGKPYVLTANHCPINTNNIFAFNYDSPTCTPPTNPTGNQTINGCYLRSNNSSTSASDFNLVELTSVPPAAFRPYYAGWSNLDQASAYSACIHHPLGDVKKISLDDQAAESSGYYSPGNDHWAVLEWDTGTTQDASSGSPLFNEQKRVVGQLHGGDASCANDTTDYFGKFSYSWDTEQDSSRQLKYWLDPNNSGVNVVDGYDPSAVLLSLDAQVAGIDNVDKILCSDSIFPIVKIRNKGVSTLTSLRIITDLDGVQEVFLWSGSLLQGQVETVNLQPKAIATGKHHLVISTDDPNGGTDLDISNDYLTYDFFSVDSPKEIDLVLKTDDFGNETRWELRNAVGTLIGRGGSYPGVTGGVTYPESFCLYDGCYRFTIFDSFGDGFCCANGQGFYLLKEAVSGDTIDFNNTFSGLNSFVDFCVGDSCTILVEADIHPVSAVNAEDGSISLNITAGNPPFTLDWNNGEETEDIENLAIGTYTVLITDSLGCTGNFSFEVKLTTGISNPSDQQASVLVYPNPSNGKLNVRFENNHFVNAEVAVYDIMGRMVHPSFAVRANETTEIDLSSLQNGIYFMVLNAEDQQVVRKIMLN